MLVMLAGLYLVLRIAGLTQPALTVVGGTGLIGLVLGIAFRDITENSLASLGLFLSLQCRRLRIPVEGAWDSIKGGDESLWESIKFVCLQE